MGKGSEEIQFVQDRLGHDLRYALDSSKLRKLGWKPRHPFMQALQETVQWYKDHKPWWQKIKNKSEYKAYLKKQYKGESRDSR
jgi:dTDP-glucose 4,6-dehydratase